MCSLVTHVITSPPSPRNWKQTNRRPRKPKDCWNVILFIQITEMNEIGHCTVHLFLSLSSLRCGLTTTSFLSILTLNSNAFELSWYSCPISSVFWNVALRWSVCLAYNRLL
mmetsp:Transcript_25605/g.35948  ORF Transcript_25605/g.35948 Transcript_25605/m.35948 type:complete len:111 (-) Transcript_25605:1175-1507(-)